MLHATVNTSGPGGHHKGKPAWDTGLVFRRGFSGLGLLYVMLFLGSCLLFLVSCGLEVGTGSYISARNNAANSEPSFKMSASSAYAARTLPASIRQGSPGGALKEPSYSAPGGNGYSQEARKATGSGGNIVSTARSQTGVPYRLGGTTPQKGFDCSGLVYWVYKQYGISVPRLAKAQASSGRQVSSVDLRPGDIVAFRINGGYHTGIYSGNGNFIHSPRTGSRVREENLRNGYWSKRFIGGRRMI
ncbi:MAG: C40 family peptidase [Desulfovibrionaceae bacterium]|nr:C40 family peptidase [Desulfovibrionaceae bacterium]